MTPDFATAKLLVIKIGSALIVDGAVPRTGWLDGVAADIAA
ncbi:MAG: glutamate 5-kinase, partial [Pseudomonadota bacterium]|nr:glutamate 5-kinase [Pseudomonadota bacterium]